MVERNRELGFNPDLPNATTLINDNHSDEAKVNRVLSREARANGKIFVLRTCSDARAANGIPRNRVIHVPSIATAGPIIPYGEMISYQSTLGIVNAVHYDGLAFKPGEKPTGCGGLLAKEASKQTSKREGKAIESHIDKIPSEDPIITNFFEAEELANNTEKPVLAAAQDHRSGIFYPIALFLNRGREIRTNIPIRYLYEGLYNPKKIYENGIPFLDETQLTEEFQEFLELNLVESARMQMLYPDFAETTKSQNPGFLIFTSEKTTARERYPKTLEGPSSYFSIHIPRGKIGEFAFVDKEAFEGSINQAQYPIEHFSNIHTVLIETPNLLQSRGFAQELIKKFKSDNWRVAGNFQVLAAASTSGITTGVEVIKPL